MVGLPAGRFVMGDDRGDASERPEHTVSIMRPFAIGKFETTVGQWDACVVDGGCRYRPERAGNDPNLPVRNVSWDDAQDYVKWLRNKTGKPYRLPTEAEWEYAARGNTRTTYWWGSNFQKGKAACKDCGTKYDRDSPPKVGFFAPNPFGLYDMNGSVWEWVGDCWNNSYAGSPKDGSSAWEKGDCHRRVIRGGSWRNDHSYIHSASRFRYDADVRYLVNGFRVARNMD